MLVELGNLSARPLVDAIDSARLAGVENLIPGADSLLVEFDPLATDFDALARSLQPCLRAAESARVSSGRTRHIPVVYDGPDLDDVAPRLGLLPAEVAALHASGEYPVQFIGFAPGFPYLGDLPAQLVLPRRATPRERVPAGSVAIAGSQTGIYPRSTPGGWHLIGRTPIVLFDPQRDPPAYFAPGDRVRFVSIAASDWNRYVGPPDDWGVRHSTRA